ncbi:MAG TPA: FAD:protein FMN transferase [Gammaproteobacteria bacterium]|nr:FAD:protein FMN transferase [Gammaproteobacteria bacterium]
MARTWFSVARSGFVTGGGGARARMTRRLSAVCALQLMAALIAGCAEPPADYHQSLYIFGTLVDITVHGVPEAQAAAAIAGVDEDFQRMHREWHAWKPGGELVELNRHLAAGESTTASDFLLPLLQQARTLSLQSDGLFNPAIGGLISLWGFHSDEPPPGPPPPDADIESLLARKPDMADLVIEGNRVSGDNTAIQLDLGGFAKGYALNLAIARLHSSGVDNAIVNAGGDLCVSGRHGDRPWQIGIRHPQGEGVIAALAVADGECVLTSGNYERYREYEEVRYAHIIDPRTGWPVRHVASVTVIHADGAVADAAATALTVAGPEAWQRIAQRMGLVYVMLVDENGTVYLTPAMAERVRFADGQGKTVVVGDL